MPVGVGIGMKKLTALLILMAVICSCGKRPKERFHDFSIYDIDSICYEYIITKTDTIWNNGDIVVFVDSADDSQGLKRDSVMITDKYIINDIARMLEKSELDYFGVKAACSSSISFYVKGKEFSYAILHSYLRGEKYYSCKVNLDSLFKQKVKQAKTQ